MLETDRTVAYSRPMHSDYRHAHRHSALAHGVKLYLRILRRKHILTKEMLTGRIPQHAAPVPASLKRRFRFTHHAFRDHGFWTVAPEKQQSTQSETAVDEVSRHDFMLSADGLRPAGKAYAGALPDDHHRHSPKHARLNGVAPISLFTGTHDVLYPDIVELRDRLRRQAHPVRYFEYPQMFHVWPAVTALDEARHAIDQMAALIKEG